MNVDKAWLYKTQFALEFRRHLDVARAHDAANAAVARAEEADRRRRAGMKPTAEETPPFPVDDADEQLDELINPRRRPALLARRPDLKQRLSEQVGPLAGWPPARRDVAGLGWDQAILMNVWQLAERLDDGDPRRELVEKAQKLADEMKVDFLTALETAKAQHPELVERVASYRPWDQ